MPASLRPLSTILCTIHPRPKRRTFSDSGDTAACTRAHSEPATAAPPTADVPFDGSPTLVGEDDMPIATTDDTSDTPKMHAYARASGPETMSNGAPVSKAKGFNRADTPQVFSSIAPRQSIGEGARLAMPAPKPTRFGAINNHARSQSGAPSQSPPHAPGTSSPMRRARSNSNDRGVGGTTAALWAPSVLSDSEFNSPTTDPDASRLARLQSLNHDVHPALSQPPPNWNPHQSTHFSEFIIGNDGMMKVRPIPNGNRNQQHHQPQDNHYENHRSLEDPFEPHPTHQTNLPVRENYPKKPYPEHQHPHHPVNHLVDEDERRGAIPSTFESARAVEHPKQEPANRRNPIFPGTDEDDEDFDLPSELEQVTPRGPDRRITKTFLDSPMPYSSPSKEDRGRKRRWQSCDYDDNALSSMAYADLQGQPFDADPSAETSPSGHRTAEGNNLSARLEYYKSKSETDQKAFFGAMSLADWDGAGDWFLEQFGVLMQQMKENRRRRREVVASFEGEIAEREEGVRMRTEGVKKKLDRMKREGLKVVADE